MAHSLRTSHAWAVPVVLLTTWLAFPSPGWAKPDKHPAGTGNPYDAAREAEARLDYKSVIANATAALELTNTHERLVTLYGLLGTAYGVLGRNEDSVDAFTRLLAIDPEYHLPRGLSPKVTRPFKEAGGYWLDRPGGLAVAPTVPREIAAGKPVSISVKLEDPMQMASNVRLSYRQEGTPDYTKLETPVGPSIAFNIPAEQIPVRPNDYSVELYVTALGPSGSELRSAGDAAHPLLITVRATREPTVVTDGGKPVLIATTPPPPKKPLIKQWWLWTAVGVVVVGASVGGGLGYYFTRDTTHVGATITSTLAMP